MTLIFTQNKNQPTKNTLLQAATSSTHEPKLAREYFFSHPKKIKKQKISPASKK
jgi:hypothetical protein